MNKVKTITLMVNLKFVTIERINPFIWVDIQDYHKALKLIDLILKGEL